jgi:hypothetical protein
MWGVLRKSVVLAAGLTTLLSGTAWASTNYVETTSYDYETTTYTNMARGFEIAATSEEGTFVGQAEGDLPGYWRAVVRHEPLSDSDPAITGGELALATLYEGAPVLVTGQFSGGSITLTNAEPGCGTQEYAVRGDLANVGIGSGGEGTGEFSVTLTHYRTSFLGSCVAYAASVQGAFWLSF